MKLRRRGIDLLGLPGVYLSIYLTSVTVDYRHGIDLTESASVDSELSLLELNSLALGISLFYKIYDIRVYQS